MNQLPLEDSFSDIVGKAMRGLKLSASEAATKSGLPPEAVNALVAGEFNEASVRAVSPVLHLDADALVGSAKKAWRPGDVAVPGLAQFTTPWDDMMVNSYIAFDDASREAVAFDTGADCTPMLEFLEKHGLKLKIIALTHTHGDHIFDLDRLKSRSGARAIVGSGEPIDGAEPVADKAPFKIGALNIAARLTWGHSKGGLTYVIHGLPKPVAVVGDAVFAGSMGGGMVSYADALRTNREQILTLPDETVLCPGHGPLTTVGEEKRHNPFLAASH